MQTNRRKVGILIMALGLILLGFFIYLIFFKKGTSNAPIINDLGPTTELQLLVSPVVETGTTTPGDAPRNEQQYDISKEDVHLIDQVDLEKRALLYSERLGSYSSQSDYGNFSDLQIYMSANMRTWADNYVAELRQGSLTSANEYYGIITKSLIATTEKFDNKTGQAKITVETERRESGSDGSVGTPYRQKIDLDFVKVNGEWLIDKAYWQK